MTDNQKLLIGFAAGALAFFAIVATFAMLQDGDCALNGHPISCEYLERSR